MCHYIPTKLVLPAGTAPLICALPECQITVPPLPAPPPFSLLKATSAMLNPTAKDVRIFFCSGEHRDKYWQSEQGWLDRRVAMPSERALTGPAPLNPAPYDRGTFAFGKATVMPPALGGGGYGGWIGMPTSPLGMSNGMMPLASQPTTPVPHSTQIHPQVRIPWTPPFIPRPGW